MNKPFTVTYIDFKQGLADLINNSKLPAVVIESILQNYLNEISGIAKNQYQAEKTQYEESLTNKDIDNKND